VTTETTSVRKAHDLAAGQSRARRAKNLLHRGLREPLVHFFAIGLVLFALAEHQKARTDFYRIVVTPGRVRQLAERYRAEFGAEPPPIALAELVDRDIREEVLYREGLAHKLDRDDEIIRRRVAQKMQFLAQDLAAPSEPSEAALRAWYQTHRAAYATTPTVSFSHIFFSIGTEGAAAARLRAAAVRAHLPDATLRAPERGDLFPDLYDYAGFGPEQAKRLFGDSDLSRQLFKAPLGRWIGPLRSVYGWHLVRVQSAQAGDVPDFDAVRDRVRADLLAAEQEAANRRSFEALRARFKVVREEGAERP
jgi:hypothetical protein